MESDRMKYNMIISAGEAKGVLQDGTPFVIDADMVDVFCQYSWNVNKDGYIRRSERGKAPVMLHRWIMSENNPLIIVDHIN